MAKWLPLVGTQRLINRKTRGPAATKAVTEEAPLKAEPETSISDMFATDTGLSTAPKMTSPLLTYVSSTSLPGPRSTVWEMTLDQFDPREHTDLDISTLPEKIQRVLNILAEGNSEPVATVISEIFEFMHVAHNNPDWIEYRVVDILNQYCDNYFIGA